MPPPCAWSCGTFSVNFQLKLQNRWHYTTPRTCPRIALANWGGTVTPIIYIAIRQLVLILQRGLHNCLHRLCCRSTAFFPRLQLCLFWTARSSGYRHALYSAQLTCSPTGGPLQFCRFFAHWWLMVCACHLQ